MITKKKKFISLVPLSTEAKYRFVTSMDSFHACQVLDENDGMMKLVSLNGEYYTTLPKEGNDHWKVVK